MKKSKKLKEKNSSFLKIYFLLIIIYALIGFIDSYFGFVSLELHQNIVWTLITALYSLVIFILSIIALIMFTKHKFEKITLIIPIYIIITQVMFFMLSFIIGFINGVSKEPYSAIIVPKSILILGIILSLFELVLSFIILKRFR